MNYKHAALGGTFDHFHKGHKTLIDHALSVADKIVVGVTDQDLTRHKQFSEVIESYEDRVQSLENYCKELNVEDRVELVKLIDIFGPTVSTDNSIDVLVVSPLTEPGAKTINKVRVEKKMSDLPIEVCVLEIADDGDHISSTKIRNGEIDRDGFVYASLLEKEIVINDIQRDMVKTPKGRLYPNGERIDLESLLDINRITVAIGDETSIFCHDHDFDIDFYIFDNHVQRKYVDTSIQKFLPVSEMVIVENAPGVITVDLIKQIQDSVKTKKHIKIRGEEDLAVTPAILLLPLGSSILYGQPNEGLVAIEVTEEMKVWVREMLNS